MPFLSDPSTLLSERYRLEEATLVRLKESPGRRFALVRYWLGRARLEIVFNWLGTASIWFAARRDHGLAG
ncbi:hypothetical protein [Micromonospora eburnea]|uniref:Uncharacterized protein n=1 Tax=Micromonospora eburnea TaxID=227316 RepID=A0A1C6VAJ6_9ACTN|nr:hypothetical protein [Micromonospora eburnea]SCL63349.1 hypothetical protein GA0070604_4954 [Micromonospora eburnea]